MAVPSREAIVRVAFQVRSTAPPPPNHHTLIKLNGTVIGDFICVADFICWVVDRKSVV